jgi:hypothetical protein
MIWALKQEFVAKAIQANHYGSTHYVWCDIGCFRIPEDFPKGCLFAEKTPIVTNPGKTLILTINDQYYKDCVGGGVLAGDIESWSKFSRDFMSTLEMFDSEGKFFGKDQDIYRRMIQLNPQNFTLIESQVWGSRQRNLKTDCVWFYLTYVLST